MSWNRVFDNQGLKNKIVMVFDNRVEKQNGDSLCLFISLSWNCVFDDQGLKNKMVMVFVCLHLCPGMVFLIIWGWKQNGDGLCPGIVSLEIRG